MSINEKSVWKLLEKSHAAFLTTRHGEALSARPMAIYARAEENAVYLLTSAASEKDDAIQEHPEVNIALQHGGSYLSLSGRAASSHDIVKIAELWTPFAQAWWDGPADPDIRLLTIIPHEAHYWKTPGRAAAAVSMLAAAAASARPKGIGKDKRVPM